MQTVLLIFNHLETISHTLLHALSRYCAKETNIIFISSGKKSNYAKYLFFHPSMQTINLWFFIYSFPFAKTNNIAPHKINWKLNQDQTYN